MENKISLLAIKEIVVLLIAAAILWILVLPFKDHISQDYLMYLAVNVFLVTQYFRVVINERKVFWIRPFLVKAIIGLGNIAVFIISIRLFMYFITQFEDYNYTGVGYVIKDIYPGLDANSYSKLRTTTFMAGISGMMFIILFELRMFYSIFKYRLVPGYRE